MTSTRNTMTPRVEQILNEASVIADGFGHDYVGTEHLLLALTRHEDGIGGQVLRDIGAVDRIEAAVADVLKQPSYGTYVPHPDAGA